MNQWGFFRTYLDDAYDWLIARKPLLENSVLYDSVLRSVYAYQKQDSDLWAFLCALADRGLSVKGILNPMLGGLAQELREENLSITEAVLEEKEVFGRFGWQTSSRKHLGWVHRFLKGTAFRALLEALDSLIREYGSFTSFGETLYSEGKRSDEPVKTLVFSLAAQIRKRAKEAYPSLSESELSYLAPDPARYSAMKTLTLFVRWVGRNEFPDLGLWKFVDVALIYPSLNEAEAFVANQYFSNFEKTYLPRISSPSWVDVERLRDIFRKVNPEDPAKYDYVFSRAAINETCTPRNRACESCFLRYGCSSSPYKVRVEDEGYGVEPFPTSSCAPTSDKLSSEAEEEILQRCLPQLNAETVMREVVVGPYRADALIKIRGNGEYVAEVEKELNDTSLGQVQKYRHFLLEYCDVDALKMVICGRASERLRSFAEEELGIKVVTPSK